MAVRTAVALRPDVFGRERRGSTLGTDALPRGAGLVLGMLVALPTTATFLGLSAAVVLVRSAVDAADRALDARSRRHARNAPRRADVA